MATKRTSSSGATAKRTTPKRTTSKRTTASRTTGSRTTRRRTTTTTGGYRTRRRTPRTATTLGSAFALGLIALLTRASWPVRIGLIMVALAAAVGYLMIRARRSDAEPVPESQEDSAVSPASAVSPDPAAATPDPAATQAQPAPTDPKDTQP